MDLRQHFQVWKKLMPGTKRFESFWKMFLMVALSIWAFPAYGQVNGVFTQHNDNSRTGAYLQEKLLNPSYVHATGFGKLFSLPVDDSIYAQPLYIPNVSISGKNHNMVYTVTANNSVYAFDADVPSAPIWQANFNYSGESPVDNSKVGPNVDVNITITVPIILGIRFAINLGDFTITRYQDMSGHIGIEGSPVIDPVGHAIYFVSRTVSPVDSNHGLFRQRLHGLDISTGLEIPNSPVIIDTPAVGDYVRRVYVVVPVETLLLLLTSIPGTTPFFVTLLSLPGDVFFSPFETNFSKNQNQRAALALANGIVYVAWAGHADYDDYHGYVFGFNPSNLAAGPIYRFNSTPNTNGIMGLLNPKAQSPFGVYQGQGGGGIWQAAQGPVIDAAGNLYYGTGNGEFDKNLGLGDLGDSVVKLRSDLTVQDWFTPYNQLPLEADDADLGSVGPLLIPGTTTPYLLMGDKECKFYLFNTTPGSLGQYTVANSSFAQNPDNVRQEFFVDDSCTTGGTEDYIPQGADTPSTADTRGNVTHHMHGGPVYWENSTDGPLVYTWPENDSLKIYHFNPSLGLFDNIGTPPHSDPFITSSPLPIASGNTSATPGMPGGMLSLSSDGNIASSGILWACRPLSGDANHNVVDGILEAYQASPNGNILAKIWDSTQNGASDSVGKFSKFSAPTIANGKVYVSTFSNQLDVYGLTHDCCDASKAVYPWTQGPPLSSVSGVAIDPSNQRVYVTDPNASALYLYSGAGVRLKTVALPPGDHFAVTLPPNTSTSFAGFKFPKVYVGDRSTGAIYVVDPNNGFSVSNFPCPQTGGLRYLYVDGNGNVYATYDGTSNTIKVFDPSGTPVNSFGLPNLNFPTGLVRVGDNLYVAESGNNRILKFNAAPFSLTFKPPTVVATVAQSPYGLTVDAAGNFYVSYQDFAGGYQVFDSNFQPYGPICAPVVGSTPILQGGFGIAVDPNVGVLVAARSQNFITKMAICFTEPPSFLTSLPNSTCCQLAGSPWTAPTISGVQGVAVDNTRNWVFATDSAQGLLRVFQTYDGKEVTTLPLPIGEAIGVCAVAKGGPNIVYTVSHGASHMVCELSEQTGTFNTFDLGPTANAQGICVDTDANANPIPNGLVYVACQDGTVKILDASLGSILNILTVPGGIKVSNPIGIFETTDSLGNMTLYVVDGNNGQIFFSTGKELIGNPPGTATSYLPFTAVTNGVVPEPIGLTMDSSGHIYITDRFSLTGFGYREYAVTAPGVFGTNPIRCDSFSRSYHIAVDGSGNIYTATQAVNQVEKILPCTSMAPPSQPKPLQASDEATLPGISTLTATPTAVPTQTSTPTPEPDRVVAAPNISRSGEPVQFHLYLLHSAQIQLTLVTLLGEKVYQSVIQGNIGENDLSWNLQNQGGSSIASGLYIYQIRMEDGDTVKTQTGKVVVIH